MGLIKSLGQTKRLGQTRKIGQARRIGETSGREIETHEGKSGHALISQEIYGPLKNCCAFVSRGSMALLMSQRKSKVREDTRRCKQMRENTGRCGKITGKCKEMQGDAEK